MSSPASSASDSAWASWFSGLLGLSAEPPEGEAVMIQGQSMVKKCGILRQTGLVTETQQQTSDMFGFKWQKRDTFEGDAFQADTRRWLAERYGDLENATWWSEYGNCPVVLDAGCGAGHAALLLFGESLHRLRYLGVDISAAVDVAAARFAERALPGSFMQSDLCSLPLPDESVDVILSEGVLHHTDSTERALKTVSRHLKKGGRFLFYVYRRKGPIREFTDDYIREKVRGLSPTEAWNAMVPLTRLGKMLGDLNIELDLPEPIDVLEIPAGKITLQRLFYWHIFKAYYRPEYSIEELNHINFDWYSPVNSHRQTEDQVRQWCREAGLQIEREVIEPAGITVIARKE